MKTIRQIACIAIIVIGIAKCCAAAPIMLWKAVPDGAKVGAVIYPIAHAIKGSYDLASITIWYSWDNVNWTILLSENNPDNNNPYHPGEDVLGGACQMTQLGTFYLKATVVDANGANDTEYASIPVSSGSPALPSLLAAHPSTYNYGVAWMLEAGTGKQKCWWTSGAPGGGDQIVYAEHYISPPGTTAPTAVLAPSYLISNPSVIKTSLSNGYSYAMYVTTFANLSYNDIRISFSHDGLSWTAPALIVSTQWPSSGYPWGACMPSVMQLSPSSYRMFYIDTDSSGMGYLYTRTSSDGITWAGSSTSVSRTGLPDFGRQSGTLGNCPSVAYKIESGIGYFYMAYADTPTSAQSNKKIYIYKLEASQLASGTWGHVMTLSSTDTMYWKSNPGLLKDEIGHMPTAVPVVGFATSTRYNHVDGTESFLNIWDSQLYYTHP